LWLGGVDVSVRRSAQVDVGHGMRES